MSQADPTATHFLNRLRPGVSSRADAATLIRCAVLGLAPLALLGCGSVSLPSRATPAPELAPMDPPAHQGQIAELARWWQQFEDPALLRFIEQAQAVSPSLASARARIEQSRSAQVGASAASAVQVNASAGLGRQNDLSNTQGSVTTGLQTKLQASWELDLFGGLRASEQAAEARFQGAQAQWHDARVSVAAETASEYFNYRSCVRLLASIQAEAQSQAETARISQRAAQSGMQAPASAELARAAAAQVQSREVSQRIQCEVNLQSLVALTGMTLAQVREQLKPAEPKQTPVLNITSLPARTLAQRPDVWAAQREVLAAWADTGAAQARTLPRLTLNGAVGYERYRTARTDDQGGTWSFGPVSLSLPILDGGQSRAQVQSARARYDEALSQYQAQVRRAVQEVENALLALQSTAQREEQAAIATVGIEAGLRASQSRLLAGLGSQLELEESRRTALGAQQSLIALQRERLAAWVALYRAAGGGWNSTEPLMPAPHSPKAP